MSNNANYCDNNRNDCKNVNTKNREFCICADIANIGYIRNVIDKILTKTLQES